MSNSKLELSEQTDSWLYSGQRSVRIDKLIALKTYETHCSLISRSTALMSIVLNLDFMVNVYHNMSLLTKSIYSFLLSLVDYKSF